MTNNEALKYVNKNILTDRDAALGVGEARIDLWESFGRNLFPFEKQIKLLMCPAKEIYIAASRGSGKSQLAAIRAIEELCLPNRNVYILAPYYQLSSIVFNTIWNSFNTSDFLKSIKVAGSNTRQDMYIRTDRGSNSSILRCLTGDNPDSLIGKSADLIVVDEAAILKDDAFTLVKPALARANNMGRLFAISSPREINFFAQRFLDADSDESKIKQLFLDGQIDGPTAASKIARLRARAFRMHILENPYADHTEYYEEKAKVERIGTPYAKSLFAQEYEAQFDTIAGDVFSFSNDIWFPVEFDEGGPELGRVIKSFYTPTPMEDIVIGIDYARLHDYTVCTALNPEYKMVGFQRYTQVGEEENLNRITDFIAKFYNGQRRLKVIIDATGEGSSVPREVTVKLREKYGISIPINGIKFTNELKNQMIEKLRVKLATESLALWDIEEIRKELKGFRAEKSESGNIKYKPRSGNDDVISSLGLATLYVGETIFGIG
jgi:hypothetical protein